MSDSIFCLRCAADSRESTFCTCPIPMADNWLTDEDNHITALPTNWGLVHFVKSPTDKFFDGNYRVASTDGRDRGDGAILR